MKKIFYFLISFICMTVHAQEMDERGYIVRLGQLAPRFEFELLSGDTINNDVLKGKVVVLQFTGSWCSVCRKEMPHLEEEVWQQFKDDDFILIGIDLREDEVTANEFANAMGVTYPMASDLDSRLFDLFAGPKQGVTRNIVLDKKGEIIFLTRLYDRAEFEEMIFVIDQELKKK